MATHPLPREHLWFTPRQIATILDGHAHGKHYRAKCPAHHGDNPQSLKISQGSDKHGNPCTLLYCFAHQCSVEDICAALGIPVRCLHAIVPEYARQTKHVPRAHSPRIDRLRTMEEPSPDAIAQILLEEMIVSDPAWIQECAPARQKMWELAQESPLKKARLTQALAAAGFHARRFWQHLQDEVSGRPQTYEQRLAARLRRTGHGRGNH